jgi:hypothetical protein
MPFFPKNPKYLNPLPSGEYIDILILEAVNDRLRYLPIPKQTFIGCLLIYHIYRR